MSQLQKRLLSVATFALLVGVAAVAYGAQKLHTNPSATVQLGSKELPASKPKTTKKTKASSKASTAPSAKTADTKAQTAKYHKITAKEAKEKMNGSKNVILLDVRTDEEFKEQRIEGAVLIPDTEIKERAKKELPDKKALILVYCRSGRRSALAAKELVKMGYSNVYDFGGIIDWPYDTVSG